MDQVLVTGGAGFIGSHLVEALLKQGYVVRVLDNLAGDQDQWIPQEAEFIQGDICSLETCKRAVLGVRGIFHCAAASRSRSELGYVDICTQANVLGTQNILLAAHAAGVRKIIYSGSSTYYGNQPIPHHEYRTSGQFLNAYALSKYVGEQYCLLFSRAFNLPCVILRYFNVYGLRQPQTGCDALVLGVFLRCWKKGDSLPIYGTGQQCRDFVHIEDVVRANILAFEHIVENEVFNVGSGECVSIQSLANMISLKQHYLPKRLGDAEMTLADIHHIQTVLGWKPRISFSTGLLGLMQGTHLEVTD